VRKEVGMSRQSIEKQIAATGYSPMEVVGVLEAAAKAHVSTEDLKDALLLLGEPPDPMAPLSQYEQDFQHGGPFTGLPDDSGHVLPRLVRERLPSEVAEELAERLVEQRESLNVQEAADLLGVDPSRVRHRVSERSLLGYRSGHRLHLPKWQFQDDGKPLPHLRRILDIMPEGAHPATVTGFMTTRSDELDGKTAVEWLASGGQVDRVLFAATALTAW
jgi:hypothetical protein